MLKSLHIPSSPSDSTLFRDSEIPAGQELSPEIFGNSQSSLSQDKKNGIGLPKTQKIPFKNTLRHKKSVSTLIKPSQKKN